MAEIRPQNIIIFSAGKSVENGNLNTVKNFLTEKKYNCCDWHELFANAKDQKSIALLPMLIKKIPTFDFAIILGEGTEKIRIRDAEKETRIMRDNVLFECGLCIMALGRDRVILVTEKDVRIPEDLIGVGKIGVENIEYSNEEKNLLEKLQLVINHIEKQATMLSPVVIGAAISTADGYFSNFILRFWENIGKAGFSDKTTHEEFHPDPSLINMEICIPEKIDNQVKENIQKYYKLNDFKQGIIPDGSLRGIEFRYKQTENKFTICDIPTTITASYNTVKDILNLSADENSADNKAEERFLTKELDSFTYTLHKLMVDKALTLKLESFNTKEKIIYTEEKIKNMQAVMKQVEIKEIKLNLD